jgi:Flp pilus assembly protein TadG
MARSLHARFAGGRRGTTAIEYAIVLPALLLFLLGIMDTGRLLWNYTTLYRAVEAAARCGTVNLIDCGTTGQIQSRAVAEAWGMAVSAGSFTVSDQACGLQVRTTYSFVFTIPGFSAITLEPEACFPNST